MCFSYSPGVFFFFAPSLLTLVLDREHELVGLVDQVGRRREHRVGPGTERDRDNIATSALLRRVKE